MATELPVMTTASYTSNTYCGDSRQLTDKAYQSQLVDQQLADSSVFLTSQPQHLRRLADKHPADMLLAQAAISNPVAEAMGKNMEKEMPKTSRRYVQIFIVDPDSRVPLEKSALYEGEPFLTDLTNQELFYELEIKSILADYNAYRMTVLDKKASDKFGRDVLLDPIKIRELAMTVVEIATF